MVQCDKSRDAMAEKPIGEVVLSVLSMAKSAQRITLGFSDAIKLLSKTPDEAQFCFLAEPAHGDSATHMHEVLLSAFCYEHGINIIKVDSGRKMAHVLGTLNANETCVLIRKSLNNCTKHEADVNGCGNNDKTPSISTTDAETDAAAATVSTTVLWSKEEDILVNFCENSWHNSDYCIVKLPESWTEFLLNLLLQFNLSKKKFFTVWKCPITNAINDNHVGSNDSRILRIQKSTEKDAIIAKIMKNSN